MTRAESKGLIRGARVYWRGDAADGGIITETRWDAVAIAWDNGQVVRVHHGICEKFSECRQSRALYKGNRTFAGSRASARVRNRYPLAARPRHGRPRETSGRTLQFD